MSLYLYYNCPIIVAEIELEQSYYVSGEEVGFTDSVVPYPFGGVRKPQRYWRLF